MVDVKWASYGDWSGPRVKGTRPYTPATPPTSWTNVLVYTVAYPEGGAYDCLYNCDGTATTLGLFQWTATSGRLQKLLEVCRTKAPATFNATVGKLFSDWGLTLQNGVICKGTTKLTSKDSLRALFTPPDGKTPQSGANWDKAKAAAIAFNALFLDPTLDTVQRDFFLNELQYEATLQRPRMNNTTIDSILYSKGWPAAGAAAVVPDDAARAAFWSFWQNSPRNAESYLYTISNGGTFAKDPKGFTTRLARKFANSVFGNWGIYKAALCPKCSFQNKPGTSKCVKCKASLREARYTKITKCVNKLMGTGTLPLVP